MGVSDDLQEEFHSAVLHDNMNIYHLIVDAQQVEEPRAKRKSRDVKRARSFDCGSSRGRLEIQDKPSFKKRVSNQVPSKFPKNKVIGFLTLSHKRKEMLVHRTRSLLVPSIERII